MHNTRLPTQQKQISIQGAYLVSINCDTVPGMPLVNQKAPDQAALCGWTQAFRRDVHTVHCMHTVSQPMNTLCFHALPVRQIIAAGALHGDVCA
jgi:hypothetical protein